MADGLWFYKLIIDPLTQGLRRTVMDMIPQGSSVLDIACGTGSLAFDMAGKAARITGIDLNPGKIAYGNTRAAKLGLTHVRFIQADATHLKSIFPEPFDIVVMSLAVHQFPEPLRTQILTEAIRISRHLVLADYSVPRPSSLPGLVALTLEKIAGGEHYAAYQTYLAAGGLPGILNNLNLPVSKTFCGGSGVFTVLVANTRGFVARITIPVLHAASTGAAARTEKPQ